MNDIAYIFDTSAILSHYFDEAGAEEVDNVMCQFKERIGIDSLARYRGCFYRFP